jgi:hypothetical protein
MAGDLTAPPAILDKVSLLETRHLALKVPGHSARKVTVTPLSDGATHTHYL